MMVIDTNVTDFFGMTISKEQYVLQPYIIP